MKIFADGGDTENPPKSSWLIYSNGKIIFVTDNYKYYGTEPISIYKYCWFDETQGSLYLYNSEDQNDMLKIFKNFRSQTNTDKKSRDYISGFFQSSILVISAPRAPNFSINFS